jgi:hypothetical protein
MTFLKKPTVSVYIRKFRFQTRVLRFQRQHADGFQILARVLAFLRGCLSRTNFLRCNVPLFLRGGGSRSNRSRCC